MKRKKRYKSSEILPRKKVLLKGKVEVRSGGGERWWW